jgi:hypothetical protein
MGGGDEPPQAALPSPNSTAAPVIEVKAVAPLTTAEEMNDSIPF